MKSNKFLCLPAITMLVIGMSVKVSFGQLKQPCGTDEVSKILLAQHPELMDEYNRYEAQTRNWVKNYEDTHKKAPKKLTSSAPTVYIIPLVFHILHQDGPENISDAQIMDEMRILNEDWGHNNPDTGDACTPHFKEIEGNNQVQFRLAQIDPNGNCTNGIDRIYTNFTNNANDNAKLNDWNPNKYVNVWVVKSITVAGVPDIAGYAYWPWEVNSNLLIDGVLILNNYIGSIGTSNPNQSRALTHELGHVMNLEHPWGPTNSPGVDACNKFATGDHCGDDGVDDTPETIGYDLYCPADSNCAKICDTVSRNPLYVVTENYQNFMEYSYCSMMFTQGQQERIWAALNSTEAGRSNLWDTANLIATGVYTPPTKECAPVANFYSNICYVCQGASVDFYDNSTNATPTSWLWTFSGASVNSSTVQNPSGITFNSLWGQTVSLTASDSVGGTTTTQYQYIHVSPLWTDYFGTFSEGFENPSEVSSNWMFYSVFNNPTSWQVSNTAAASGNNSLLLNAYAPIVYYSNSSPPTIESLGNGGSAIWDAMTPSVNMETASAMKLSFDYSCATRATDVADITETLEIDYSLTCGANWYEMGIISGPTLTNAGEYTNYYTPSSPNDWTSYSVNVPAGADGKANVRFRFRYTSGFYSNNIYLDNINLTGTVGIDQVTSENYNFLVYPNPTSDNATITYNLPGDQTLQVGLFDIAGREITELANGSQSGGQQTLNLNTENLSNGIYFIKMVSGNSKSVTKKLIVIK
jgi:PKD repeat protein